MSLHSCRPVRRLYEQLSIGFGKARCCAGQVVQQKTSRTCALSAPNGGKYGLAPDLRCSFAPVYVICRSRVQRHTLPSERGICSPELDTAVFLVLHSPLEHVPLYGDYVLAWLSASATSSKSVHHVQVADTAKKYYSAMPSRLRTYPRRKWANERAARS